MAARSSISEKKAALPLRPWSWYSTKCEWFGSRRADPALEKPGSSRARSYAHTLPTFLEKMASWPWTAPAGAMPMHVTCVSASRTVLPTSSITPDLVPPVMIHARVIAAALRSPRRKICSSFGLTFSDAAAPVTEMTTDGGSSPQPSRPVESICSRTARTIGCPPDGCCPPKQSFVTSIHLLGSCRELLKRHEPLRSAPSRGSSSYDSPL